MRTNVVWLPIVLTIVPGLLLLLEYLAEKRDQRRFSAPGEFVGPAQLHVVEQGNGSVNVILEAGIAASSISWVLNQRVISQFARVISYDRPGLGWTRPSKSPLTLAMLISNISVLTNTLDLSMPLILVGHSFGGLLIRAFAHHYPDRVAGLLLVDPVCIATYSEMDEQNRSRLEQGYKLSMRGALLARFGIVRLSLALVLHGRRRMAALMGNISAGKADSMMKRLASEVGKLPTETHAVIASHWSRPSSFKTMAEYLRLLPEAAQQVEGMPVPEHIPIMVLSAASATRAELEERNLLTKGHPSSRHIQIPNTTHWLQLDRPDVITEAVRQLVLLVE